MIRHIVTFTFLDAEGRSRRENARLTKEKLDSLPARIPQILASETHLGAEGQAETNADLILMSDFASFEDLAAYLVHPDHLAVGAFMAPLRQSRAAIDIEL